MLTLTWRNYFTLTGRINRLDFLVGYFLLCWIAGFLFSAVAGVIISIVGFYAFFNDPLAFGAPFMAISFLLLAPLEIKRAHDFGITGAVPIGLLLLATSVYFLALGPLVGFYTIPGIQLSVEVLVGALVVTILAYLICFFCLLLVPGTRGDNAFGPPPTRA
jgi:uncharacterized membrane protein YhaH (DUF805 family)